MAGSQPPVIVVGAGLAGLAAAGRLARSGTPVRLLEAGARPGGRVATDLVDGFRVDRGFQVLNTGYPEVGRALDLPALDLRAFLPGARVRTAAGSFLVADPFRRPRSLASTLRAPVGSLADKLLVGTVTAGLVARESAARSDSGRTTLAAWRRRGLSTRFIETFLRPFLSGVLLESELSTSARFTDLVWRSFARGTIAVPATGMGAIADQLAAALPPGTIELGCRVEQVWATGVRTAAGEVPAHALVVATDPTSAAGLLDLAPPVMRSVTTWFHAAPAAPCAEAVLVLDGTGRTPILNSVVLTNAAPTYSSDARALVATSTLGVGRHTDAEIRAALGWLHQTATAGWELVAEVPVEQALPAYPAGSPLRQPARLDSGVFVAGDWRDTPSIQGALVSGRRVADAVLDQVPR